VTWPTMWKREDLRRVVRAQEALVDEFGCLDNGVMEWAKGVMSSHHYPIEKYGRGPVGTLFGSPVVADPTLGEDEWRIIGQPVSLDAWRRDLDQGIARALAVPEAMLRDHDPEPEIQRVRRSLVRTMNYRTRKARVPGPRDAWDR